MVERKSDCVRSPSDEPAAARARAQKRRNELAAIRVANGGKPPQKRARGYHKTLQDGAIEFVKLLNEDETYGLMQMIVQTYPRISEKLQIALLDRGQIYTRDKAPHTEHTLKELAHITKMLKALS
jgi:hypothetical protein